VDSRKASSIMFNVRNLIVFYLPTGMPDSMKSLTYLTPREPWPHCKHQGIPFLQPDHNLHLEYYKVKHQPENTEIEPLGNAGTAQIIGPLATDANQYREHCRDTLMMRKHPKSSN
jgi:hypothetical protein